MVELTLKWEKFGLSQGLHKMMEHQELVDVTVMCEGQFIQAHKSVLAASSQQFKQIFKSAPDKSPVVVLRGVSADHFKNLLQFMYLGEVTVSQDDLPEFIATADDLGISALSKKTKDNDTAQRPAPEPLPNDQPVPFAQPRLANTSNPENVPSVDTERSETTEDNKGCEIETHMIKEEIEIDDEDDWGNRGGTPFNDDDLEASDPISSQPVIQSIDGSYVDTKSGLHDPGPSTSQGGEPWPEEPNPTLRRTSRPLKRKTPSSPAPSFEDSDYDGEPPQSDTSASQGFEDGYRHSSSRTSTLEVTRANNTFKCCECSLILNSLKLRVIHERSIHKIMDAKCHFCNKVFKSYASLNTHYFKYHTNPQAGVIQICKFCGSKYTLKGDLTRHIRNIHGSFAVPHKCEICNKIYKNKQSFKDHFRSNHKNK